MTSKLLTISLFSWFFLLPLTIFVQGEETPQPSAFEFESAGTGVVNGSTDAQLVQETALGPIRDKVRSEPLSAEYIEEALDAPLKSPLQFENQSLRDVMAQIAEQYKLPVLIDELSLESLGIDPDCEVTVDLKTVSLRSALNIILHRPGLEDTSFAVLNEVLMITTKEHCADSMFVRVYPTEDFVYSVRTNRRGGSGGDYSPLVALITDCVAPETWHENGWGEGEIGILKPGILVVRQEYRVHVELEKLLNNLRTELRNMEKELGHDALKDAGRIYDRTSSRDGSVE